MQKKKAIFLDIDGTIFRSSLVIEHYELLLSKQEYNLSRNDVVDNMRESWLNRSISYEDYLLVLVDHYVEILKSLKKDTICITANEVIDKEKNKIYQYTKDIISQAKQEGKLIFLISGSPDFLVEKFADVLNVEGYGSKYIFTDDIFTGKVIPLWDSTSKKKRIFELEKKYNIDLSESSAFGDTTGDLSLFELVGHPVLVNPNKKLLDQMQNLNKQYSIFIERKDVVYQLHYKEGNLFSVKF